MPGSILKAGVVLLVLVGALAVYAGHGLRRGPELRSATVELSGLREPVEVFYDSMGVPHIFAASMEDLFHAQGYVHATHRLWQMEMFRRVLQGRLSEIFGARTLETDRFLRTIGMEEAAREGMPPPETEISRQMEAYSAGVNAAIDGWEGSLPPEFVLLRFRPEPWEPFLVQGIEKIMAWDLSDYQRGLDLAAAREILGDSALAPLMPRYPEWGVTIVEGWPEEMAAEPAASGTALGPVDTDPDAVPPSLPVTGPLPPRPSPDLLARARLAQETVKILEMGSAVRASNAWVVGGERSASGKPLVANDMHLALNAPNIWFLVGLHAPGYDVVGMSIPGAPGVVAGHTPAVAWGFTNAMVDDADFFVERVNPENPGQYLTPDGWVPFEIREETIRVKGEDPVNLTVRSTRHGPVITPVEERAGDRVMAFQWVAHAPAGTFSALVGMGRAGSVEAFLRAARDFDNPHQNLVFADTAGSWGYWMGGRVPLRASGPPPHLPVPGWTGEHDWVGWVDFEDKPQTLAPERGYVVTANNAQARDESALRVTDGGWFGPYRAQRITELLEAREIHDAGSMLAIQMDVSSAFVDRNLGHAIEAFRAAELEDLAGRLERWDRRATLESTEATLFHAWWEALHRRYRDHYYSGEAGHFP
ncbi:MAG: penicillin acylase family protein, partial [Longimicrobiales bacterium]